MGAVYDAVVVGAGHNGLVAAAYLARAGWHTLVLERRDQIGGAVATDEVYSGFRFETGAHAVGRLHPALLKDLRLAKHNLELIACEPIVHAPATDADGLTLHADADMARSSIHHLSPADASRYEAFVQTIRQAATFLARLYDEPAPIHPRDAGDVLQIARLVRRLRGLGRREMMEVLRILPMSIGELVDEWFESDLLKGTLAAWGTKGVFQGPMAPGTALVFLHHQVGMGDGALRSARRVRGGMSRLTEALAAAARTAGAEIRTGTEVQRIRVAESAAVVALAGGEEVQARRIVSNADPRRTFLELLDPVSLDPAFLRAVHNIRFRSACANVNLALGELPNFAVARDNPHHLRGTIRIAPTVDYVEHAFDDAKYGELSRDPYLEIMIPSLTDPSLAPSGKHVMNILVQFAPYQLREAQWDSTQREALGDRVVSTLARYAPNIESTILHRQILTPLDLESRFGLSEGNIYHGELALDQSLFMRPVPGWSRYRSPIRHVYLCGAGAHPGGGVTGAPGYLAAQAILRDA